MGAGNPIFCIVDPSLKDFVGHHFEYDHAVAEGAAREGFEVVCLGHRKVTDAIRARLDVRPTFLLDIWTPPPGAGDSPEAVVAASNAQFLSDLEAGVADLTLGPDAIVFGHMITARQMDGWAKFAESRAGPSAPTLMLLLRYQPEHYTGPAAEAAFRRLEQLAVRGDLRVRLSTDSDRLSRQIQRLTTLPVETWPLPHTTQLRRSERRPGRRLNVVSLGNARDEKGILELLTAVRILNAAGHQDRFRFTLQANDAAPDVKRAIEFFEAERPANVTLLHEPLSTSDYFDLLESADIVAVPYWRDIYVARTSGVFLEAVAAGKPVVCTKDCWMSDQLLIAGAGELCESRDASSVAAALLALSERYEEALITARETADTWAGHHNPQSFMRAVLFGEEAPRPAHDRPTVAVLYPWGDAVDGAAGAALRLKLLIRFLKGRSDGVRVLQDNRLPDLVRDGVVYESIPVHDAITAHPGYRWLSRIARHLLGARNGEEIYFALMLAPRISRALYRRINELVRNSDLIFLEYPFWAPLVERACRAHGKTYALTTYDVVSDQIRASGPLRFLTRLLERRAMRAAPMPLSVSVEDRRKFKSWGVDTRLSLNCVDGVAARRRLPLDSRSMLNQLCALPNDRRPMFLFVGSRFRPNALAADEVRKIAADYRARFPDRDSAFVVVGTCMEPVREANFYALGRVDDVTLRLLYENCSAVLIPLTIGTGLSLKTAEALAGGQVVVGSTVAFRGLDVSGAGGWIEENDFSRYPEILERLVQKPELRREVADAAVQRAAPLDFRNAFAPYLDLFPALAAARPREEAVDEDFRTYLFDAAGAALRLGRAKDAEVLMRVLVEAFPDFGPGWLLKARLEKGRGKAKLERAREDLRRALLLGEPASAVFRSEAETLREAGRSAEAETSLARAAEIEADAVWTAAGELKVRADLWRSFAAGDREWAGKVASAALARRSDLPGDYGHILAHALADKDDAHARDALRAAEAGLAGGYDRFWSLMQIGSLRRRLGDEDGAREAFVEAASIASSPEHRAMAVGEAAQPLWAAFDAGRFAELETSARRLLGVLTDQSAANYLLAEALRLQGCELLEACERYRAAIRGGFPPYWPNIHLGHLLVLIGEAPEGLNALVDAALSAETEAQARDALVACTGALAPAISIAGGPCAAAALLRLRVARPDLLASFASVWVDTAAANGLDDSFATALADGGVPVSREPSLAAA